MTGRGAIGGCHCSECDDHFGGMDVVPNGIQKKHPEKLP